MVSIVFSCKHVLSEEANCGTEDGARGCPNSPDELQGLEGGGWWRARYTGLVRGVSSHAWLQASRALFLASTWRASGEGFDRSRSGGVRAAASMASS